MRNRNSGSISRRFERHADAGLEAVRLPAHPVEREQGLEVRVVYRTTPGTAGQRAQNLPGAGVLPSAWALPAGAGVVREARFAVGAGPVGEARRRFPTGSATSAGVTVGPAGEDAGTARRHTRTGGGVRPVDGDALHARPLRPRRRVRGLGDGGAVLAQRRLQHALLLPRLADERHPDHPPAGAHRHAHRQIRVGPGAVIVPVLARKLRLAGGHEGPGEGDRRGLAGRRAADREPRDAPAVDPQIEVVHLVEIDDVLVDAALEPDRDEVLAIERELMADREAGARPERQVLAHPVVLRHRDRDAVDLRRKARPDRRIADREAADAPRRRQVALHQHGRERQRARQVVEAVAGVVGRQQGRGVDFKGEQIADGVRVLGAIQAVGRHPSRLDPRRGGAVELGFEPRPEAVVGLPVRARATGRGHHAAAQLQDDLLPCRRRVADAGDVQRIEREPARPQPLVVASDAVAIEQRARGHCRGGGLLPRRPALSGGLRARPGGARHQRAGSGCTMPTGRARHGAAGLRFRPPFGRVQAEEPDPGTGRGQTECRYAPHGRHLTPAFRRRPAAEPLPNRNAGGLAGGRTRTPASMRMRGGPAVE